MPDWLLQTIITTLIIPCLAYVGIMARKIITVKVDSWLAASAIKQKEELRVAFAEAVSKLSDAVYTSVMETQRTFVAAINKEGPLTSEQSKEAFQLSYNRVKEIMSQANLDIIQDATGSLEQMIKAEIEAQLPTVKAIAASTSKTAGCTIQEVV